MSICTCVWSADLRSILVRDPDCTAPRHNDDQEKT